MLRTRAPCERYRRFTPLDALLILALLCAGIAFIPIAASHAPSSAVIYHDNRIVAEYPLSSPKEFFIRGENGGVTIRISDAAVSVVSSRCPRQICRHSRAIRRPFEQIVCVPNHLLIEIRSGGGRDLDAIAR
jgi:hypothetical protein